MFQVCYAQINLLVDRSNYHRTRTTLMLPFDLAENSLEMFPIRLLSNNKQAKQNNVHFCSNQ